MAILGRRQWQGLPTIRSRIEYIELDGQEWPSYGFSMSLEGPPGFVGLDPHTSVTKYFRHLPHWWQKGATYVVTFRQADALPREKIEQLKLLRRDWELRHPEPRSESDWEIYAREYTRRIDAWLDEGLGSCGFRSPENVDVLGTALTRFHKVRYHTGAYVVMPNHCHVVIRPFANESLEKLLDAIKGSVAREINLKTGNTGCKFWMQESYDRIIRDENHLTRALEYIHDNPAKANLAHETKWRCWIAPDWQSTGWSPFAPTT